MQSDMEMTQYEVCRRNKVTHAKVPSLGIIFAMEIRLSGLLFVEDANTKAMFTEKILAI